MSTYIHLREETNAGKGLALCYGKSDICGLVCRLTSCLKISALPYKRRPRHNSHRIKGQRRKGSRLMEYVMLCT